MGHPFHCWPPSDLYLPVCIPGNSACTLPRPDWHAAPTWPSGSQWRGDTSERGGAAWCAGRSAGSARRGAGLCPPRGPRVKYPFPPGIATPPWTARCGSEQLAAGREARGGRDESTGPSSRRATFVSAQGHARTRLSLLCSACCLFIELRRPEAKSKAGEQQQLDTSRSTEAGSLPAAGRVRGRCRFRPAREVRADAHFSILLPSISAWKRFSSISVVQFGAINSCVFA